MRLARVLFISFSIKDNFHFAKLPLRIFESLSYLMCIWRIFESLSYLMCIWGRHPSTINMFFSIPPPPPSLTHSMCTCVWSRCHQFIGCLWSQFNHTQYKRGPQTHQWPLLLMPRSHIMPYGRGLLLRSTICKMWFLEIIRSCRLW